MPSILKKRVETLEESVDDLTRLVQSQSLRILRLTADLDEARRTCAEHRLATHPCFRRGHPNMQALEDLWQIVEKLTPTQS